MEFEPGSKNISKHIDEAATRLDVGDGWNITFFFSGNRYCQVKWKETENDTELLLLDDGKKTQGIKDGWPGAGFTQIDAILPYPGDPTLTWNQAFW
ncbi:hypothetical protein FRC11_013450 [Ceratobasidium sp. 423]|nr:hypothetical protein FRC11_013450 [Ceratobasidium sp. 423]